MELNKNETNALIKIIDIYHDIELNHYEESIFNDNETDNSHIWHSIKTLSLKLKNELMKDINK